MWEQSRVGTEGVSSNLTSSLKGCLVAMPANPRLIWIEPFLASDKGQGRAPLAGACLICHTTRHGRESNLS
jgi:hypothetical protein